MIHSMTAFARVGERGEFGQLAWEIRSVNHRYLDVNLKLPDSLSLFEQELREHVRKALNRGKVDCYLKQFILESGDTLETNQALLNQLIHQAKNIKQEFSESANVDVVKLLNWPGVLVPAETNLELIKKVLFKAFDQCLRELVSAREREGKTLSGVLLEKLTAISQEAATVKQRMPEIAIIQREKIQTRLNEASVVLDPNRLEQELVILANKIDVSEELDRLDTHINEVSRIVNKGGAIGRRLDFFMQELNREANTLASKSTDAMTTQSAVNIKVLIEQMREQVQNIE